MVLGTVPVQPLFSAAGENCYETEYKADLTLNLPVGTNSDVSDTDEDANLTPGVPLFNVKVLEK
jgi:hypothetical protein